MKKNIEKIYDLLNSGDFKLGFILGNSLGFSNIEIMNKLWDRYNESYSGLDWRERSIKLGKYWVFVFF
tara:strand:+ start:243 stop:446 length:204 start_codon:yes stop_codon:yes gene_type:complete